MFCSSNVLKEILDTERKYVDDLKYLCEVGRVITLINHFNHFCHFNQSLLTVDKNYTD